MQTGKGRAIYHESFGSMNEAGECQSRKCDFSFSLSSSQKQTLKESISNIRYKKHIEDMYVADVGPEYARFSTTSNPNQGIRVNKYQDDQTTKVWRYFVSGHKEFYGLVESIIKPQTPAHCPQDLALFKFYEIEDGEGRN